MGNMRLRRGMALAWMIMVALVCGSCLGLALVAMAEEKTTSAWILCQPDSFVNIRAAGNKKAEIVGRMFCGDEIQIDGKTRAGYAHSQHLPCDNVEGWIHAGYIVFDAPEKVDKPGIIRANGRVACRKTIDGERRCWVVNGSRVMVYWACEDWAVTDKGFIQTKYIEID